MVLRVTGHCTAKTQASRVTLNGFEPFLDGFKAQLHELILQLLLLSFNGVAQAAR